MSKSILIHMLKDVNLSGHQILIGDTRWHLVSEFISSVVNQFKSDLKKLNEDWRDFWRLTGKANRKY